MCYLEKYRVIFLELWSFPTAPWDDCKNELSSSMRKIPSSKNLTKNAGRGVSSLSEKRERWPKLVKSEREVVQSCPTLRDPMGCSPPGSSVYGIFQARVLEWGAIAFSNIHIYIFYTYAYICTYTWGFPGGSVV